MPTSSQKSTTPAGTLYDHNAIIRPLFYDLNLGTAYDINGDGNSWRDTCSALGAGTVEELATSPLGVGTGGKAMGLSGDRLAGGPGYMGRSRNP